MEGAAIGLAVSIGSFVLVAIIYNLGKRLDKGRTGITYQLMQKYGMDNYFVIREITRCVTNRLKQDNNINVTHMELYHRYGNCYEGFYIADGEGRRRDIEVFTDGLNYNYSFEP